MENKKKILISIGIIIVLIIFLIYYIFTNNSNENTIDNLILIQNEESSSENTSANEIQKEVNKEIAVHIVGEVKKEGIVYVKDGSRVADVIKKAGGETKEADLSQVNLAYKVQDGEKIYIPNKNEKVNGFIAQSDNGDVGTKNTSSNNKININTANINELDSLPGIGPSIAQRIIDYREANGNFKSIEDLQNVKGIGTAKYEEIKDRVSI